MQNDSVQSCGLHKNQNITTPHTAFDLTVCSSLSKLDCITILKFKLQTHSFECEILAMIQVANIHDPNVKYCTFKPNTKQ